MLDVGGTKSSSCKHACRLQQSCASELALPGPTGTSSSCRSPSGDHARNLTPAVSRPSLQHSMRDPQYQLKGPPLQPEVRLLVVLHVAVVHLAAQLAPDVQYQLNGPPFLPAAGCSWLRLLAGLTNRLRRALLQAR